MNRRILTMIAACAGLALSVSETQAQTPVTQVRNVTTVSSGTVVSVVDTARVASATPAARKGVPTEITLNREVFDYNRSGRRDPYKSLMTSSDVRPLLSDLRLTAVAFDPDGNNSVAILRDTFSKQQYRIRVGQQLGRLRVAGIKQKTVQFTIEEFGFNRQETLALASDTTKVRNP